MIEYPKKWFPMLKYCDTQKINKIIHNFTLTEFENPSTQCCFSLNLEAGETKIV